MKLDREIFADLDDLIDKGFEREDENTTDDVRWIWLRKVIDIRGTRFTFLIEVTYLLTISDDPFASYDENFNYSFEKVRCFLRDDDDQNIFCIKPKVESLDDFDNIEKFF